MEKPCIEEVQAWLALFPAGDEINDWANGGDKNYHQHPDPLGSFGPFMAEDIDESNCGEHQLKEKEGNQQGDVGGKLFHCLNPFVSASKRLYPVNQENCTEFGVSADATCHTTPIELIDYTSMWILLSWEVAMTSENLLSVRNLSRAYGDYQALKPVDFSLGAGDLVSLVGPNGSGKSTLLMCLSGLLRPTTGEICVQGFDAYQDERQVRQRLAYVPDVPVFYQELTAWEHLKFMAFAHHVSDGFEERAAAILGEFGLWQACHLFPHAFSRGMRLKLGLALAIIRPFEVLLLDEPSSALDSESTEVLCQKLVELCAAGKAILLTTHDLHFLERINVVEWNIRDGSITF
jgi:ABC-2 type transport system ATP-binding protein